MAGAGPTIIIAATPTSNGDLHIGHMAGPYLAGDVYARYLRAAGHRVIYTTCTDDSQTYVVSTAHRRGRAPAALCASSTAAIGRSLEAMGIGMAGLPPIDERYRATVLDFVTSLHHAGRFRPRTVRLPYATDSGTFLFDGLVGGTCPSCLAASCGGVCEACGHPNNYDELLDPYSTMNPEEPVVLREQTILVLPLEDYRDRLVAYYTARADRWRPHARQLIREILARPLPDAPVTMPGAWGIPAPFPETPGQILYPWVEAMPASMYSTWWSAARLGEPEAGSPDEHWLADRGAEVVYFHGYDNVYHWGLMDLVLLMAHGDRYTLPASNVCNEFYDLDGDKFSTSRNHLIWSVDLLAEVPRDLVRFYLALTAPEYQRTNFSREGLERATARHLVEPWNALADTLSLARLGADPGEALPTTAAGRQRAAVMVRRFRSCYELSTFSLTRAAETVVAHLARLRAAAERADGRPTTLGDLFLQTRALLAGAAPILIDVTDAARAAGVDVSLHAAPVDEITPFPVRRLPVGSDVAPAVVSAHPNAARAPETV
jgi:methionyl-tRNA synthetase